MLEKEVVFCPPLGTLKFFLCKVWPVDRQIDLDGDGNAALD